MRRLLLFFLVSACGGGGTVRIDLPIEEEHRALVLAVEDGEDLSVYAFDLTEDRKPILHTLLPSYIGSYEIALTAFLYRSPLANLGIEPGTMLRATQDPSRPIPTATSTLTATIRGEKVSDWTTAEALRPPVAQFRIPAIPAEECILEGGCFALPNSTCLLPCPPVSEPDPPEPPALPVASCPNGWEDVEVKPNIAACTPWIGDVPRCDGFETIFPGESSCHPLGPGCPAGTWPENVPPGTRIHVRAGAAGGDGSENAPYGTITAALQAASGGEVIVIAAGTYRERLYVTQRVTLYGACPEQTIIDGPGTAAITSGASNVSVQNLRITADDDGVEIDPGASLDLQNVIIEDTGSQGVVLVNQSQANLQDVLIRNTGDTGIWLQGRAALTGTRVHVVNTRGGVGADNASLTLIDSVVRDARTNADGSFGRGANIQNGAVGTFRRTIFSGNHDIGVFVSTAMAELDQCVVRRTLLRTSDDAAGFGLLIQNRAETRLLRSWIDDNHDTNVHVTNDSSATIEDTVLSRARITGTGAGGFNLQNHGNSSTRVRRVVAIDPAYTSINVGTGKEVAFEDLVVIGAGIHPQSLRGGDGIHIQTGEANSVHVDLTRVRVEEAAAQAISLRGVNATASLSDVTLARSGEADCFFCSGLCLNEGAKIDRATRIDIRNVRGTGVYAFGQDTRLIVSHIAIDGTPRSASCVLNHNVRDVGRGVGLYSADGATIDATSFLLSNNAESGAEVAEFLPTSMGTGLDLSFGIIRDNPIGTTVLIEGYDSRRIANRVVYSGNNTNLNYEQ